MHRRRVRVVQGLVLLAVLAFVAGSVVDEPEFDLTSGREWSERMAAADASASSALRLPAAALERADLPPVPPVASGWILLAGGLILAVVGLAIHANSELRLRTA